MNIEVNDYIQENLDFNEYSIFKDITLGILIYLFYINVPSDIFIKTLKIFIIIILSRYILSLLTTYKLKDNKKYFQYNSHIAFVYILILTLFELNNITETNKIFYMYYIFLLFYTLFIIGCKHVYTTDALSTIFLTLIGFKYLNKNI